MLEGLQREIKTIQERDPAAKGVLETVLCYPGFHALMLHRVAHWLYGHKQFFAARIVSHLSRFFTGIEIHPGARIGSGFFIDHGSGVVIGETAEIGDNVTLYQGVTLGGTGKEKGKRHPTIGSNVVIGSGAKILGSITIGDNVKVGAGSVVVKSVPANTTVVGVPAKVVKRNGRRAEGVDLEHGNLPDPVAEVILHLQREITALRNRVNELEDLNRRTA
ncbi:MAG: serine O-acetyltransferase [Firmicutes bacterium]|nr:serine O-acetyltransferase [Bacillota bacterium]